MKERPILFSAPMVRAILEGRKTQTRRIFSARMEKLMTAAASLGEVSWFMQSGYLEENDLSYILQFSPYGQPGDRLWVRETWGVGSRPDPWGGYDGIEYRADIAWLEEGDDLNCHKVTTPDDVCLGDYRLGWKPSIHMPRWACRILLEVTGIRVERLNDISEEDAVAEGCETVCMTPTGEDNGSAIYGPDGYAALWDQINSAGAWEANPFVWVVEFKRVTP